MREVALSGVISCSGLSMVDSLGVFVWYCIVKNGTATFYSIDFQSGKGLQNLINGSGTGWNYNSVTLAGVNGNSVYSGTSTSSVWGWTNPITIPTPNPLPANAQVNLSVVGTIYVVTSSQATSGFNVTANQVALVTLPGVILNYAGENTSWCNGAINAIICASNNFVWIEGNYDANSTGTNSNVPIYTMPATMTFSRFHLVTAKNATQHGIAANKTTNCIFDQINTSNSTDIGFDLESSTGNFIKELVTNTNGHQGIALGSNYGPNSISNTFYQITSLNNAQDGLTFGRVPKLMEI